MDYMEHFTSDPQIVAGQCVFRGTRVTLRTIIASLADGDSFAVILRNFPALKRSDINAAIAFAARSAISHIPRRGLPASHPERA
ncbi:MAG: DUF433 domain-containing protein [Acidobacteriota bacterium]